MQFELGPEAEFAGHRVERVIGRGGMSVVYLAEHIRLGRKVALKVLFPHLSEDPGFRDRFIRESRTAARLDHANIVTVYDAGEVDGLLYLSMRYVEGTDLGKVLRDGVVDPWRTIAVVSQIASALDAAHAEGLVHRDVKPANILLSRPGTAIERAFLSDFGITKRMTTEEALTRTGQFVGTVEYVAPEQIRGEPVDGRADVYSLGCVLFQCLSGESPFQRPTDVATIYAHLNDEPPNARVDVPGMDGVIARALAKHKEDRHPTCGALAEAARSQLQSGEATKVLTASHRRPPSGERRRRPKIAALVAVLLALAVAGPVVFWWSGDEPRVGGRASHTTSPPPSESPRPSEALTIVWNVHDWATIERPRRPPGGQVVITSATVTGEGVIVAAGHADDASGTENAAVWTRRTPSAWQPRRVPGGEDPDASERIWDVTASGSLVVGVGYDDGMAAAWYSEDGGVSWQQSDEVSPGTSMHAVVATPRGFTAFGRDDATTSVGATWTSGDGSIWRRVDEPGFEASGTWSVRGVFGTGSDAIAVGQAVGADDTWDAAVWEFRGGAWVQIDPEAFAAEGDQQLLDVVGSDGTVVAVGAEEDERAIAWTKGGDGAWVRSEVAVPAGVQTSMAAVTMVDDRYFVAAGWAESPSDDLNVDAAVWFSTDGLSWRRQSPRTDAALDLAGPGFETIRALMTNDADGTVLAFGEEADNAEYENSHAQVWIGFM